MDAYYGDLKKVIKELEDDYECRFYVSRLGPNRTPIIVVKYRSENLYNYIDDNMHDVNQDMYAKFGVNISIISNTKYIGPYYRLSLAVETLNEHTAEFFRELVKRLLKKKS